MSRPEGVKMVRPVGIVSFEATRWTSTEAGEAIDWMAARFGWRVGHVGTELRIHGRNGKRYPVKEGNWVIALGTNGSIRVCSDKQYRQDYREVSE